MNRGIRLDGITLLLAAWSVGMSVSGQLALRSGMAEHGALQGLALAHAAFSAPMVLLGIALYLLATVAWIAVLSRIDLAVAYPLAAMNYVLVTVLSATVLHEVVTPLRWGGTVLVLAGILVVARGERGGSPSPGAAASTTGGES